MISLIVAHDKNNVIGFNNKIPWYLPEDLKHFKKITTGKTVIMGRKTFESIGKELPNRKNIVLTKSNIPNITTAKTLTEAINISTTDETIIIGGYSVYKESLDIVEKMYITIIYKEYEGDTFFPEYDKSKWKLVDKKEFEDYEFNKLIKFL